MSLKNLKILFLLFYLFILGTCGKTPIVFVEYDYYTKKIDIEFEPYDYEKEKMFMFKNSGSKLAGFARFADNFSFWIYKIDFVPGTEAHITLKIDNQYRVLISHDNEYYSVLLSSGYTGRDASNLDTKEIDLTSYIEDEGTVYLKFVDEHPSDGWGVRVHKIKVNGILRIKKKPRPSKKVKRENVVFQIGKFDNHSDEFALAPDRAEEFQSKFPESEIDYMIGKDDPDDFPYIQPCKADSWAGNKEYKINIYFKLKEDSKEDYKLKITFYCKIQVNSDRLVQFKTDPQ